MRPSRFEPEPPYEASFSGLPAFRTLRDAETTLARLESLRKEYSRQSDLKGLACCRQAGVLARLRAEGVAANPRVAPGRRALKREIGTWFAVWLETPDLFEMWLELRKRTAEFEALARMEPALTEGARRRPRKGEG